MKLLFLYFSFRLRNCADNICMHKNANFPQIAIMRLQIRAQMISIRPNATHNDLGAYIHF